MKTDEVVLYMHAGSGNHGCEAIVNGLCGLLPAPAILMSTRAAEDMRYSLGALCAGILQEKEIEKHFLIHSFYYGWRKLARDPESFMRYRYRAVCGKNARRLNISIGGDNYCYENMLDRLLLSNRMFHRQGGRTVLYGCSVEPDLLKRPEILEDMKRYDAIVARESLTYEALRAAGVDRGLYLCPDPAFLMEKEELPLPEGWAEGRMLGLNVSPMIVEKENKAGITMENYRALIGYVLEKTDLNVVLIPHVVWESNDDRKPLARLYEAFEKTGRVLLLPDASAPQLKGYISRCRLFVGARTHAVIAAYSSCVPTLALGYSIKAKGIAQDLFGTDQSYVLPVQALSQKTDLIDAFGRLFREEETIRRHLEQRMPDYRAQAKRGRDVLSGLAGD